VKKQIRIFALYLCVFMLVSNFFVKGNNVKVYEHLIKVEGNEQLKQKLADGAIKVAGEVIKTGVNRASESPLGNFLLKTQGKVVIIGMTGGVAVVSWIFGKKMLEFVGNMAKLNYRYNVIDFSEIIKILKEHKNCIPKKNAFISNLLGYYVWLLGSYYEDVTSYFARLCMYEGLLDKVMIGELLQVLNNVFPEGSCDLRHLEYEENKDSGGGKLIVMPSAPDGMRHGYDILIHICNKHHITKLFLAFLENKASIKEVKGVSCSSKGIRCACTSKLTSREKIINRFTTEFVDEFNSFTNKGRRFICSFGTDGVNPIADLSF